MANPNKLVKLLDPEIRAKNWNALRVTARGLWWDIQRPIVPDPVFVIGCSRSGTTVTYETLASSQAFSTFGFEIPQFWNSLYGPLNNGWESEAAGTDDAQPGFRNAAFRYFYQHLGKGLLLDKTCINTMRIPFLYRLFPNARFVFIHRNGYDNISSMMDGWRKGRTDGGFGLTQFFGPSPTPVSINYGEFSEWHFFLPPGWRAYNQATLEDVCAFQWMTANRMALDASRGIPAAQWIQIRYEDIIDHPEGTFREVFERLDIDFNQKLQERCSNLQRHPTSMVSGPPKSNKWLSRNPEAIHNIADKIRPMMLELGYDTSF